MSEGFAPSSQFDELAQLPPDDPRRKGFEAQLASLDATERKHWLAILQETDAFYAQVADVPLPPTLSQRLLQIPDTAPRQSRFGQMLQMRITPVGAAIGAVAAAVVIALIGYLGWQPIRALPPVAQQLDDQIAHTIAAKTIEADTAAPTQIASSDPATVQAALSAKPYTFPVVMLTPKEPLALSGGGSTTIGATPAVFTRWKGQNANYTLFEFDGKALGMPAAFLRNTQTPKELWQGSDHYRVILWPGKDAACTWALVMNTDTASDEFSSGY